MKNEQLLVYVCTILCNCIAGAVQNSTRRYEHKLAFSRQQDLAES